MKVKMEKMLCKWVAIIMALCMLVIVVGGCSKDKNGQKSATAGKSGTVSTKKSSATGKTSIGTTKKTTGTKIPDGETETDTGDDGDSSDDGDTDFSEDSPEEETIDLDGRVIRIGVFDLLHVPAPDSTMVINQVKYKNMLDAQDKFNCKIEFIVETAGATRNNQFVNNILAGVDYLDVFQNDVGYFLPSAIVKKLIYPITDYLDFDNRGPWDNPLKDVMLYKGERYAFPQSYPFSAYCVLYNRDIFERAGLPRSINSYYKDNNWTWDKMLEMAQYTTLDFNGDGMIDQYGIQASIAGNSHIAIPFVFSNGGDLIKFDGEKYIYALNQPASIRPLNFVSDLFNIYNVVTSDAKAYNEGRAAMLITTSNVLINYTAVSDSGYMPIPRSPEEEFSITRFAGCQIFTFTTTTPENVREGVVKAAAMTQAFWDETRPEFISIRQYLKDINALGANNNGAIKLEEDLQTFADVIMTAKMSYASSFAPLMNTVQTNVFSRIIKREYSVTQAIEMAAPIAQGAIDSSQQ